LSAVGMDGERKRNCMSESYSGAVTMR